MISKMSEALQLLASNCLLIVMVILTVWLPGNLLINYLTFFVLDPDDAIGVVRVTMLIEGILGPIYLGAMIYALWQIKQGQSVSYGEAIRVGFKNWGRLFVARFVAGLLVGFGLLVFIVPGVVLALRFALLDCTVIVEGAHTSKARRRSTQLTQGIKLQILGMVVLFFLAFMFVSMVIYMSLGVVQALGEFSVPVAMASEVAADCVLDVLYAVLQIALFLYYWDMRQSELVAEQSAAPDTPFAEDSLTDTAPQLDEIKDDGNPYRSSQT